MHTRLTHFSTFSHWCKALSVAVLLGNASAYSQALKLSIAQSSLEEKLSISFQGDADSYFILESSFEVEGPFQPNAVALGRSGNVIFQPPILGNVDSMFFRVLRQPQAHPLDLDHDGIDDVSELLNSPTLDPLDPTDASADPDADGIPSLTEFANGWNLQSGSSPTPVEFGRAPGGPHLVGVTYDSEALGAVAGPSLATIDAGEPQLAALIPNLIRILPEVSVNSLGVMAYIAEIQGENNTTYWQLYVARRNAGGSWQHVPVMTDAQAIGTFRLGPGLQINDANTILVRRATQSPTPLGPATFSFMEIWNGNVFDGQNRGQRQTVANAEPLNLFAEFSIVNNHCAYNNRGSTVFFAEGRSGRYIVSTTSSGGGAKTPLGSTIPYTPISVSDTETIALRIGDAASGSLRLMGLPDIGNRQFWRLDAGSSGFSNFGLRPGISQDGRIMAFYADYSGPTNANIGTTGPGIFGLVNLAPITPQNVSASKLVRFAGLAGNGQLDPGETWQDLNQNQQLDPGEDEGNITMFLPDEAIGVSRSGIVAFGAMVSPPPSSQPTPASFGGSFATIVGYKLKSFATPALGPQILVTSVDHAFSGGFSADSFHLHDPVAGSSAAYVAFSASDSVGGQSLPLLAKLVFPDIRVTDKETISDKVPYAADLPTDANQNQELCLRALPSDEAARVMVDLPNVKEDDLRAKYRWRVVDLATDTEIQTGEFLPSASEVLLSLKEGAKVEEERYFEIQVGDPVAKDYPVEQRIKVRLVRDRLNWWFEPLSNDLGWRTSRPEPRRDTHDYKHPQRTSYRRESLQSIYQFLKEPAAAAPASYGGPAGQSKVGSWLKASISCFGEFHEQLKSTHSDPLVDLNKLPRLKLKDVLDLGTADQVLEIQKFIVEKQTKVTVDPHPLAGVARAPEKVRWAKSAALAIGSPSLQWYDLLALWQKEGSLETMVDSTGIWISSPWPKVGAAAPRTEDEARLLYLCELSYIGMGTDIFMPHGSAADDNPPDLSDYAKAYDRFIEVADKNTSKGTGAATLALLPVKKLPSGAFAITPGEAFFVKMLQLVGGLLLKEYHQPEGIGASYAAFNGGGKNVKEMRESVSGLIYKERARLGFEDWAWHYEVRINEFANPPPYDSGKNKGRPGIRPNAVRFLYYRDVFRHEL